MSDYMDLVNSTNSIANLSGTYGAVTAGGNRMVAFGDSTVLGNDTTIAHSSSWPTYAQLFSGGQIYYAKNAGVVGNQTSDLLARFATDVAPAKPNIVVLGIGRNDINNGVSLATYQANIATLVGLIRSLGALPVITTITPTNGTSYITTAAWNRWLTAYARANNLPVADFFGALVDPTSGQYVTAYNSGDGIHPSAAGYAVLGQVLATALQAVLPPPALMLTQSDADTSNLIAHGLFMGGAVNGNGEPPGWYQEAPAQVTGSLITGDAAIRGNWHRQACVGTTTAEAAIYTSAGPVLVVGHVYIISGLVESALTAGGFTVEMDANGAALYAAFNLASPVTKPGFFSFAFTATQTASNLKLVVKSGSAGYVQFAQVGLIDATALGIAALI